MKVLPKFTHLVLLDSFACLFKERLHTTSHDLAHNRAIVLRRQDTKKINRKSLAQERFKSNLEFRYQTIVSSKKFRKDFVKFMILIALFKKFLS